VLTADLTGAVGPGGLLPAGGEISCRGRVVIVIDMQPKGPLGLATALFDIEISDCPEGTVMAEGHVHEFPGHPDPIYLSTNLARRAPLSGSGTIVTSRNEGVDPRRAAEVIADPGRFGYYLHTDRNPVGGAGRGKLRSSP
jgi:hypothetical protein